MDDRAAFVESLSQRYFDTPRLQYNIPVDDDT